MEASLILRFKSGRHLSPWDVNRQKLRERFAHDLASILQRMLGRILIDCRDDLGIIGREHGSNRDPFGMPSRNIASPAFQFWQFRFNLLSNLGMPHLFFRGRWALDSLTNFMRHINWPFVLSPS